MKVKQTEVVKLLAELGMATADKWPIERLEKKLQALPKLVKEEGLEAKTADGKSLLKKILAAVKGEEEIEISVGGSKEEAAPAKKSDKKASKSAKKEEAEDEDSEDGDDESEDEDSEDEDGDDDEDSEDEDESEDEEEEKPAKKDKKSSKKAAKEEESEDDESEDEDGEDDEEEEKPSKKDKDGKKKGPPKSAGGDGKPGIIASIVEFLQDATEEKPISKKKILEKLVKRFPDREADSMARTINVQVPNRIKNDKGLVVAKNDKNQYWISGKVKGKKDE